MTRRDGERKLAAARTDAERDDPDWTWDRLNAARRRPPEGRNGADLIPRIHQLTRPEWHKFRADQRWGPDLLDPEPNERFAPEFLAALRGELADSAEAVALARTLKGCPTGHREIVLAPDVLSTRLNDTQATRHAADLLKWDAVQATEDANGRRVADDLLALLNTSRSIGDEPLAISQLVRIAVRAVTVRAVERALGQVADLPTLAEVQTALAADADEPLLLFALRGDRTAFDGLFGHIIAGTAELDGKPGRWGALGRWQRDTHFIGERARMLDAMTERVRIARLPIHEQPAAFAALPPPPDDLNSGLAPMLLIVADRVAQSYWRSTADPRCAVAGIACEQFRQRHGRWPGSLAELVPALLPAVPLDPSSGEPLRYAKQDTGVVVYSVGGDRSGTAGTLDPSPSGVAYPRFRLWNPDQRRHPSRPTAPAAEHDP